MTHQQMKQALAAHRAAKGIVTVESNTAGALGMLVARAQHAITTKYASVNINGEEGIIDRFMTGYDFQRELGNTK